MAACTSKLCRFALVKFRNVQNITSEGPPGAEPLPQETESQQLAEAMRRAEMPNDSNVSERCDKDCHCFAIGVPRWDIDESGNEKWHRARITFKVLIGGNEYRIRANGEALDGVQDGKCRPGDDAEYELAMLGRIPALGISFTVRDPKLITGKVLKKLRELEKLA